MSRLEVWRGGAAEGPLVLFLPGCPDSRWAAQAGDEPARRAGVRLVAVNRPGYGASTPSASTHLSVADDLVVLAAELGAERFSLLGMSVGGTYALACAARHPDRVTAVVTVACPADLGRMRPAHHRDGLAPEEVEQLARVAAAPTVGAAVELLRPEFERYRARVLQEVTGTDPEDRRVLEALTCPDGYLRDAAHVLRPWAWDPGGVRCPVLVVHGAQDRQASPRNAHWLAAAVPGAELRVLEGAGHLDALHDSWEDLLAGLAQE